LIEALGQGKFTSKHLDKIVTNSMRVRRNYEILNHSFRCRII
jgi:hypothetical protein